MYTKYENAKDVAELERLIKSISPDLRITGIGIANNLVTRASVLVLEKGNKQVINKLLEMGFRKSWREKVRRHDGETDYSGYAFQVRLEIALG